MGQETIVNGVIQEHKSSNADYLAQVLDPVAIQKRIDANAEEGRKLRRLLRIAKETKANEPASPEPDPHTNSASA